MGRAQVAGLIAEKKNVEQLNGFDEMSDEELAEFIRTNAADILEGLDQRKAPPLRERH